MSQRPGHGTSGRGLANMGSGDGRRAVGVPGTVRSAPSGAEQLPACGRSGASAASARPSGAAHRNATSQDLERRFPPTAMSAAVGRRSVGDVRSGLRDCLKAAELTAAAGSAKAGLKTALRDRAATERHRAGRSSDPSTGRPGVRSRFPLPHRTRRGFGVSCG